MNHSWLRYWFCLTAAIFRKRQSRIASAPIKIRELIYQCIYKPPTNRFPSTNFLVYLLLIVQFVHPTSRDVIWESGVHATSTQAPPASLILYSAVFENSLALIITGTFGITPFPRTLTKPCLVTSITGAVFPLVLAASSLVFSSTRVQSLSQFTTGAHFQFLCKWNTLIPFFPK